MSIGLSHLAWSRMLKPRIRGPVAGRLWVCRGHLRTCTGMTPEQAYASWLSFEQEWAP